MYNHLPPSRRGILAEPFAEVVVVPFPPFAAECRQLTTKLRLTVGSRYLQELLVLERQNVRRWTSLRRTLVRGAMIGFESRGGLEGGGSFRASIWPSDRSFISERSHAFHASCQTFPKLELEGCSYSNELEMSILTKGYSIDPPRLVWAVERRRSSMSAGGQTRYCTETQ